MCRISYLFIGFCVTLIISFGCSKRSLPGLRKNGMAVSGSEHLRFPGTASDTIQLQYLGCGGFYIRHHGNAIMIDPFFSHQRFYRIGKSIFLGGKIKSRQKELDYGKMMIKDSLRLSDKDVRDEVKGIFAAHGHYDHLMDVPFIHQQWCAAQPDVYVNTSSTLTCANVIPPSKLHDVEKIASVGNTSGSAVAFDNGEHTIRVYPVFADHNPHVGHIKFFAGSEVKTPDKYRSPSHKTSVNDWLEGQTLSFLIDFLKKDSVTFRMFIQSSSCQFPNGIPPERLLAERKIDLAVLGVASYQFSENTYPCAFLEKLAPSKVMFIHWEDFFRMLRQRPKAVKKNDVPRFFNEVFSNCRQAYSLPLPGSVMTVSY